MKDEFAVSAKDTEVLDKSHLTQEMSNVARYMETFPVLLDDIVAHFHNIDGGYHRSEGYHVINFIHEVQGPGSPNMKSDVDTIEAHIDDIYFWLEVADTWTFGEYPDEAYVLSAQVTGYQSGPYSFSQELSEDVDKRAEEYSYE